MIAHSPQDDQECEVAEDVDDQEDTFCQGQFAGEEDIKGHRDDQENHNEQRCLPKSGDIGVFVLQQDQALHQRRGELGSRRTARHPSKESQPADDVAERLFNAFGREFRNPVIYSEDFVSGPDVALGTAGQYGMESAERSNWGATPIMHFG